MAWKRFLDMDMLYGLALGLGGRNIVLLAILHNSHRSL